MRIELPNRIEVPVHVIKGYLGLERRLGEARAVAVPESVQEAYGMYQPVIEAIYGSSHMRTDRFYHGTGHLQYAAGEEPGMYKPEIKNTLDAVLDNGLVTAPDGWLPTPGDLPTTSLSRARFYARSYALLHESEEVPLAWQYGTKKDWGMFFGLDSALDMKPGEIAAMGYTVGKIHYGRTEGPKFSPAWFGKIRNDIPDKGRYMDFADALSTVENNFPVIAVFEEAAVPTYRVPGLARYEDRTLFDVQPGKLLALEVPLSQVEYTTQKVRERGLSMHVVPMECVDLHASQFPTEQHTKVQRNVRTEKQFRKGEKQRQTIAEADIHEIPSNMMERASGIFGVDYHPQRVIDALRQSSFLSEQYSQMVNFEGQTLYYNTLAAMLEHEKYNGHVQELPGGLRPEFYRTFLAVHDIGKPLARFYRTDQHTFNSAIGVQVLEAAGAAPEEITLARTLLSQENPVGVLLKKYGTALHLAEKSSKVGALINRPFVQKRIERSIEHTRQTIVQMANANNFSYTDMLDLLVLYHQTDAASYTTDGGSSGTLNYVFDIQDHSLHYSASMQSLVDSLGGESSEGKAA